MESQKILNTQGRKGNQEQIEKKENKEQDDRLQPHYVNDHINYKWSKQLNWKAEFPRLIKESKMICCLQDMYFIFLKSFIKI